jgi:hypothetical protein
MLLLLLFADGNVDTTELSTPKMLLSRFLAGDEPQRLASVQRCHACGKSAPLSDDPLHSNLAAIWYCDALCQEQGEAAPTPSTSCQWDSHSIERTSALVTVDF